MVFFKHFACKNQLPGLSVSGTLVKNGLNLRFLTKSVYAWKYRNPLSAYTTKYSNNLSATAVELFESVLPFCGVDT